VGKFYIKLVNFPTHKVTPDPTINYGYGLGVIVWLGGVWIVLHDYGTQQDVYAPDVMPSFYLEGTVLTFTWADTVYSFTTGGQIPVSGLLRAEMYDSVWQDPYQVNFVRMSSQTFTPEDGMSYSFDMQTGAILDITVTPGVPPEQPVRPSPVLDITTLIGPLMMVMMMGMIMPMINERSEAEAIEG
jgi:hypothetical protein